MCSSLLRLTENWLNLRRVPPNNAQAGDEATIEVSKGALLSQGLEGVVS